MSNWYNIWHAINTTLFGGYIGLFKGKKSIIQLIDGAGYRAENACFFGRYSMHIYYLAWSDP